MTKNVYLEHFERNNENNRALRGAKDKLEI